MSIEQNTPIEERNENKKKWIALLLLLLLAIGGFIAWLFGNTADDVTPDPSPTVTATETVIPSATPSPTATTTATTEPAPKEFDITVDGVAYTTKATLTTAVKSPSWVEPMFQCATPGQEEKISFFTTEDKIDAKFGISQTGTINSNCLLVTHDPTDQEIGQMKDPNYVASDISGRYNYNYTVLPFDEAVVMEDKLNKNYKGGTNDYFFYSAMNQYDLEMGHRELYRDSGVQLQTYELEGYVLSAKDPNGWPWSTPETTISTPEQETAYRAGWANAEKLAIYQNKG